MYKILKLYLTQLKVSNNLHHVSLNFFLQNLLLNIEEKIKKKIENQQIKIGTKEEKKGGINDKIKKMKLLHK